MSSPDRSAPATGLAKVIRMMPFGQRVVVFGMTPLMLLGGVQFVTQALVLGLAGNRNFEALSVFGYIAQWWQPNPAASYGAPGSGALHWIISGALIGGLLTIVIVIAKILDRRAKNPQLRPGLATDKDIIRELGTKQLVTQRGPHLRPSLANKIIEPAMVGFWMGIFRAHDIWLRIEDPIIVIGPSRAGKGWRLLLRWILTAPGAVITTSVKLDNFKLTMLARQRGGAPVALWAPGIEGGKDFGHILKWDPVDGCIKEETLIRRVNAMIPSGAFSGSTSNGGHWDALGRQLASHLFHAAACGGRTVDDIWGWVTSPKRAEEAVRLIRDHSDGMNEHADHLEYVISMPHEQRATSWGVLPTVLAFMESRTAREWMKPEPHEVVDLAEFIMKKGTIYIVGDKMASPVYVRMNDALLAEFDFVTKGLAAASAGSRLDPPVTYVLDEAGNIEYQGMYELITAGGGQGRIAMAVYQSKNQLDQVGDSSTGATLWDAAVAKIILPGGADAKALGEISELIGDVWVERESHTLGSGDPSAQFSAESRAAFTKTEIRTMKNEYAFLFYRNLPLVIVKTSPFSDHPRFAECIADASTLDASFRESSEYAKYISNPTFAAVDA